MKNLFFYVVIIISLISCNKSDDVETGLVGQYQLLEVLADPGDGSGTFQPVNSNKIIEFHSDGTITSNGEIGTMGVESNSATTGTYSLADSTISSSNCSNLSFELNVNELIINYPCIEPCRAKFLKQWFKTAYNKE